MEHNKIHQIRTGEGDNNLYDIEAITLSGLTASVNDLNKINSKANLDSPTLTGIPTAPTADATINNNQIATTAFVQAAVQSSSGGSSINIVRW